MCDNIAQIRDKIIIFDSICFCVHSYVYVFMGLQKFKINGRKHQSHKTRQSIESDTNHKYFRFQNILVKIIYFDQVFYVIPGAFIVIATNFIRIGSSIFITTNNNNNKIERNRNKRLIKIGSNVTISTNHAENCKSLIGQNSYFSIRK